MVTKREIYAVIAGYGLGKVLPAGSTARAAKRTVIAIARPAGRLALGLAKRHPGVAVVSGLYAAHELGYLDPVIKPVRKKTMSAYNRAVKETMKIFKAGTVYGKKGVIKDSKKAFAAAAKLVSRAKKGQKAPKRGNIAIKKAFTAAAKILRKVSPDFRKLPKRRKTKKDYRDYDPQG